MKNILPLIQPTEWNATEMTIIAECLSNPTVKKYLRNEALIALATIAEGLPKKGETESAYLLRQAQVVGSLAVFDSLLGIEKPAPVPTTTTEI